MIRSAVSTPMLRNRLCLFPLSVQGGRPAMTTFSSSSMSSTSSSSLDSWTAVSNPSVNISFRCYHASGGPRRSNTLTRSNVNVLSPTKVMDATTTGAAATTVAKRYYTPMTKEEEEQEKARVAHLSPQDKDTELRQLNREIARLEMLRGINNGELYSWSGRYKALMRDYGYPLFVYYWAIWGSMGLGVYLAIGVGGLDAMQVLAWIDSLTGFSLAEKVDPELGKIGVALLLNEALEPIRLPFVVVTLKPAMDAVSPPKY